MGKDKTVMETRVMTMGAEVVNMIVPHANLLVQSTISGIVLSIQNFDPDSGATDLFAEVKMNTREALYLAYSIIRMAELSKEGV